MLFEPEKFFLETATFDEILSSAFQTAPGRKGDTDRAAARLTTWCKSAANGDWQTFAQRLAREGLTLDGVLARFSTANVAQGRSLPEWVEDAELVAASLREAPEDLLTGVQSLGTHPFEHAFASFVRNARVTREGRVRCSALEKFGAMALADLDQLLLAQAADLCMPILYERFADARSCHLEKGPEMLACQPAASELYRAFIIDLRSGGFDALFAAYPVLLRLLAVIWRQWIDATVELIQRFDNDADEVGASLLGRAGHLRIVRIEGGLSDLHNEGRSVLRLHTESGESFFYKPKDLSVDAKLYALVETLNGNNPPEALRALRVIARGGYGWTESVGDKACTHVDDVQRFYRRSGGWLALLHVLCATDMHEENMVADGDHPVPIDVEMLLQPGPPENADVPLPLRASVLAGRRIAESVASVGLLPGLRQGPDTRVRAGGGLNVQTDEEAHVRLEPLNTDAMAPVERAVPRVFGRNLPRLDGDAISVADYSESVTAGYDSFAAFLAGPGHDVLATFLDGPARNLPMRVILRTTQFYAMLINRLKDHSNMGDGVTWSVQADFTARFFTGDPHTMALWPLAAGERAALAALNVPLFVCAAGSNQITDARSHAAEVPGRDALTRARSRLADYRSGWLAWEQEVVRLSFLAQLHGYQRGPEQDSVSSEDEPDLAASPCRREELIVVAADVARLLSERAIRDGDSVAWLGLDPAGDSGACQLTPLRHDFYGGTSGIAVFLAAYARVTSNAEVRRLAMAALAALRHRLRGGEAAMFARAYGVGGAVGLGSFIYALTVAGDLLDEPGLLNDARCAAALMSEEMIEEDRAFDVVDGSAGAILALLKLHGRTDDGAVLRIATACGHHLLKHRRPTESGLKLWPSANGKPFTGFSHGTAGFAYALSALADRTGDKEFAQAARDCIAYENAVFSPEHGNWPDFRGDAARGGAFGSCQWCHGAGGIGLARLAMGRADGGIDKAIRCVLDRWPASNDTLCCGNLGNLELLIEAGRRLGKPELEMTAGRLMRGIIERARRRGDYAWDRGTKAYNLGLFRGMAGVGYSALRLADPHLPNPLIWD